MYISVTSSFVYKNLFLIQIGFRPCLVCLIWRVLGDSPISGGGDSSSSSSSSSNDNSILIVITIVCNITWVDITFIIIIIISSSSSSSNDNSILIVITIVCNVTWVDITFIIIISSSSSSSSSSNGAGDVGRKPEVIDA